MLSMLPLRLAILPVSCSFFVFESLFSPGSSHLLFGNSLISLDKLIKRTNFHQNSIFVAETHVYIKPLSPNRRLLPSNARSVYY